MMLSHWLLMVSHWVLMISHCMWRIWYPYHCYQHLLDYTVRKTTDNQEADQEHTDSHSITTGDKLVLKEAKLYRHLTTSNMITPLDNWYQVDNIWKSCWILWRRSENYFNHILDSRKASVIWWGWSWLQTLDIYLWSM